MSNPVLITGAFGQVGKRCTEYCCHADALSSPQIPGDPKDDRGWAFTGWFDTSESQALLDYQRHDWPETIAWVAESQGRLLRTVLPKLGPVLRPVMRAALTAQRRVERRGRYADPWTVIVDKYGPRVLAGRSETPSQ